MKRLALLAIVGAAVLIAAVLPAGAQTAALTWVSGTGDDTQNAANPPCPRTNPCKTFAGAISATSSGGTITCLDPGGYGGVTILISVTIDCEANLGGVLVSGTNGISVNGSGIVVNLRGLRFNGSGNSATAINISQAAAVYIKNAVIFGFTTTGINFAATGGKLVVNNTSIYCDTCSPGVVLNGGGTTVNATLRDVVVQFSITGVSITSGGVVIDHTTLALNPGTGLNVNGSGVVAMIGNSTITGSSTGVSVSSGTLYSFKQNQIAGNGSDGTPITAFPGPGGALQ